MDKVKGLNKEQKARIKDDMKKDALKKMGVSDEEISSVLEAMEEIKKPIVLKDKDIILGEGEVDVRGLSDASFRQLMFRCETAKIAALRSIDRSLTDVMRLQMLSLKNAGVENIAEELDNLYKELVSVVRKEQKA